MTTIVDYMSKMVLPHLLCMVMPQLVPPSCTHVGLYMVIRVYRSLQAASRLHRRIFNYFGKMIFVTSKMNFF